MHQHQKLIEQAVQTRAYDTADDVIEKALELLQCDEICLRDSADSVDAEIERGFAQFESGEYKSHEAPTVLRGKCNRAPIWHAEGSQNFQKSLTSKTSVTDFQNIFQNL